MSINWKTLIYNMLLITVILITKNIEKYQMIV